MTMYIYEVREHLWDAFGEDRGTITNLFMSYNGALSYVNSIVERADEVYEPNNTVRPFDELKVVSCSFLDEDDFCDTTVRVSISKKEVRE